MSSALGGGGVRGGMEREGRPELVVVDAPEGVFGIVSDSLYGTELAGMVGAEGYGYESAENMHALEAGGLQGEAEWELVQVEGVAAETVEISDFAIPQHVEVASNEDDQRARYHLLSLDKDGFRVSDLVWSKLKGHPWWRGEIYDPSDASELALKHQKKGTHLVAFFGDNSFAWCDESQLNHNWRNKAVLLPSQFQLTMHFRNSQGGYCRGQVALVSPKSSLTMECFIWFRILGSRMELCALRLSRLRSWKSRKPSSLC